MGKVFFALGSFMLVAAAAALYILAYRLDGIVETRIEKAATIALGSRVEVGGVRTSLRDGTLSVERISVANPTGFDNPYAVQLNAVEASVDYDSLEVESLVIENPRFFVEEKDGKTNFDQILHALDADTGPEVSETESEEPVIVIRHLRIDETQAAFDSDSTGRHSNINVDAIEMKDLRGTPSELAEEIARRLIDELNSEAASEMSKGR